MNNADFWKSVSDIIAEGFTPEGLHILDYYAELFISGRIVYQRFSPLEQRGCAAGGETHVIASLLAGAEDCADTDVAETLSEFERERQRGAKQEVAFCVVDSDIRIYTPELRQGGKRVLSTEVFFQNRFIQEK